jgi:D-ribose pyranase
VRSGTLWHPRLLEVIARLGHTETIVLADAGFPVPVGVETVDLLWSRGEPQLLPILAAVLAELEVERATIAAEAGDPALLAGVAHALAGRRVDCVPHERLKELSRGARAVVRTGECTPFANVMLHAGVVF